MAVALPVPPAVSVAGGLLCIHVVGINVRRLTVARCNAGAHIGAVFGPLFGCFLAVFRLFFGCFSRILSVFCIEKREFPRIFGVKTRHFADIIAEPLRAAGG